MAHPGGRPTNYDTSFIERTKEYLSKCVDEYEEFHKSRGEKVDTYDRLVKVNLPTIEGLALFLGINRSTLYVWEREHEEFKDIIDEVRAKQAEMLIKNGLSGDYNPTIAKVLLTKHGYRDAVDSDLTSGGKEISGVDITIRK